MDSRAFHAVFTSGNPFCSCKKRIFQKVYATFTSWRVWEIMCLSAACKVRVDHSQGSSVCSGHQTVSRLHPARPTAETAGDLQAVWRICKPALQCQAWLPGEPEGEAKGGAERHSCGPRSGAAARAVASQPHHVHPPLQVRRLCCRLAEHFAVLASCPQRMCSSHVLAR